ncbi:hypothetical protein BKA65DRAFT_213219 [Rhexocercosporidium sp. MPI-PUGE-AT-0058]|nr:hypothetical protein BKA65DRAFT_213219 [Rhexocercosporidium sp. MPI-PUGE-AT-0058]
MGRRKKLWASGTQRFTVLLRSLSSQGFALADQGQKAKCMDTEEEDGRPGREGESLRGLTSLGELGEVLPCLDSLPHQLVGQVGVKDMGGVPAVLYRTLAQRSRMARWMDHNRASAVLCCTHKINAHPQPSSACPLPPFPIPLLAVPHSLPITSLHVVHSFNRHCSSNTAVQIQQPAL